MFRSGLKMQTNSIVISNFNSLCYDIEPRIIKEISFNLLKNMLSIFTTVRNFSYAKDVKEKHKIKRNKSKSQSLRRDQEILLLNVWVIECFINQSQLQSQAMTLNLYQKGYFYSHTLKKNIFKHSVWILNFCQILDLDYCVLVRLGVV